MPKKLIIVFILGAVVALTPLGLRAQTEEQSGGSAEVSVEEPAGEPFEEPVDLELLFDPQQGSGELSAVKEQIQSLLRQNAELAPQAAALRQEFLGLQERVKRLRDEVAALEQERGRKIVQLRESGEPQSLELLQVYDMEYQKKQLEIELKLQELAAQRDQQERDRQLAELQKEVEENAARAEQLAGEENGSREKNHALAYELESLKQENILLENQLKLPVTSQGPEDLAAREGPVWESIRRKEEQKERLKRGIEQLELEAEGQGSSLNLNDSSFERELRGSADRVEKENRQLQAQIFSLQEKIQKRPSVRQNP